MYINSIFIPEFHYSLTKLYHLLLRNCPQILTAISKPTIYLGSINDRAIFTALESGIGTLFASDFATVNSDAAAATSSAEIVYNSANGRLFYNADNADVGFGSGGHFATLTGNPAITRTDILVIA